MDSKKRIRILQAEIKGMEAALRTQLHDCMQAGSTYSLAPELLQAIDDRKKWIEWEKSCDTQA